MDQQMVISSESTHKVVSDNSVPVIDLHNAQWANHRRTENADGELIIFAETLIPWYDLNV